MTNEYKDWGWLNGLSKHENKEFSIQMQKHRDNVKKSPNEHIITPMNSGRCASGQKCSCGFAYMVDSGD